MRVGLAAYAETPSGLAVSTIDAGLALRDAGAEVVLFAEADAVLPPRAQPLAGNVVRLERPPPPLRTRAGRTGAFLPAKLVTSRALARALRREPVDVVHAYSPGLAAALPRDVRSLAQAWFHPPRLQARLRTLLPFVGQSPLYPAAAMVQAQSHASDLLGYRRAGLVLANTPTAERALRARGFRTACVPPPIYVPDVLPEDQPGEVLRVAFCGHPLNLRRKGLRHLLKALPATQTRPLEVTLVGGLSSELDSAIATARSAGVEIRLLGRVSREEYLEQLERRTDVLVFPSLYEEWGYALFEALSRGVPAIAFDLYPFFDIVDADTGRLVAPGDAHALATAIDEAAAGALPPPTRVIESTRRRFGSGAVVTRLLERYRAAA